MLFHKSLFVALALLVILPAAQAEEQQPLRENVVVGLRMEKYFETRSNELFPYWLKEVHKIRSEAGAERIRNRHKARLNYATLYTAVHMHKISPMRPRLASALKTSILWCGLRHEESLKADWAGPRPLVAYEFARLQALSEACTGNMAVATVAELVASVLDKPKK